MTDRFAELVPSPVLALPLAIISHRDKGGVSDTKSFFLWLWVLSGVVANDQGTKILSDMLDSLVEHGIVPKM